MEKTKFDEKYFSHSQSDVTGYKKFYRNGQDNQNLDFINNL